MLRTVGRDAFLSSSRSLILRRTPSHCVRLYSTPTVDPTQTAAPNPTPTAKAQTPTGKPKIDLRPAPIKPKPASSLPPTSASTATSAAALNKSHHARPHLNASETPVTVSLASAPGVKEEVKRDMEDAEAHGILIPPPKDASWFKRTLHQAIQLVVRVIVVSFYS